MDASLSAWPGVSGGASSGQVTELLWLKVPLTQSCLPPERFFPPSAPNSSAGHASKHLREEQRSLRDLDAVTKILGTKSR